MGGYTKKIIREGELRKRKDNKKIKEKIFPNRGDTVVIHYVVRNKESESIIDSSRQKSMPYTFEAGCAQIIRAIDEAVMKMSLGERAILEISVVGIGWYLGGTVGVGTLLFAFGIGPAVALSLFIVGKFFN